MNPWAPIAVWGFWMLLAAGWLMGELGGKGIAAFVLLWLAGFFAAPHVLYGALFLPYVAVLDIALVLTIFGGDVTLK